MDFARSMVRAAEGLFSDSGLAPVLAFTFSDEINLIFLQPPLGGRIEKIDSLIAGHLSAALSLDLGQLVSMDCRTIPICREEIGTYLCDRQNETWRNHVFSYGFYILRRKGLDPSEAMAHLRGLAESEIHEMVFNNGINLAKTPAWERRGVLVYRKCGDAETNWEPPLFSSDEGALILKEIAGL